ncbi:cystatin-B [Latimeria chalumnae]|uniref:cystatin-B n=1 Tax=Latimeria chalumnae TaxID=7897 RepID=UPI0006D91DCC|nr:PREDICTED: cystatin-A [Latimeria chalumnae]|eukprot:XP_014351120.1 PREDICTED: cystatin-A [Latimeria chalumnae]
MSETQSQMCCGGLANTKPADPEVQAFCDQVKAAAEEKAGKTFEIFDAKRYKTQVVAGMNYFIKVHVGGEDYVHLRVHKPLPHKSEAISLASIQTSKSEQDELSYF